MSTQVIWQAEQSLLAAERTFSNDPSPSTADQLKLQARVVNGLHFKKAKRKIFYTKQRSYECRERAGRLLAYVAHLDHKPPTVVSLRTPGGSLLTDPDEVAREFRSFFASLYTSATDKSREEIDTLLRGINLPTLAQSQVDLLEAPISKDEITEAMSLLNTSKAPGSDGLP